MRFRRRRRPTAEDIIALSIDRGDYATAALFTYAGALEYLSELDELAAAERRAIAPAEKRGAIHAELAQVTAPTR